MCIIFVHVHGEEKRTSGVLIPYRQEKNLPRWVSLYHRAARVKRFEKPNAELFAWLCFLLVSTSVLPFLQLLMLLHASLGSSSMLLSVFHHQIAIAMGRLPYLSVSVSL